MSALADADKLHIFKYVLVEYGEPTVATDSAKALQSYLRREIENGNKPRSWRVFVRPERTLEYVVDYSVDTFLTYSQAELECNFGKDKE
jgi:hypothetical protein